MTDTVPAIPGADALAMWFGYWPSFHDAEINELHLDHSGVSWIKIHTWHTANRIDENGYNMLEKHVIVTFNMNRITDLILEGFSHQNVISDIVIEPIPDGFVMTHRPCYGLAGLIEAAEIQVEFVPTDGFQGPFA